MNVSTDPYSTLLECEAKIPEVLQSAVNHFVERYPQDASRRATCNYRPNN